MPGGAPPNVVPQYNPSLHQAQPGPMGYQMMPAPGNYMQQGPQQGPQAPRYSGSDSPRNSPRHMQPNTTTMQQQQSPSSSPVIQHASGGVPPTSRNPKSPQASKNSPLSLASITSPFHTTDSQSKKYHAQTPKKHLYMAGERLRLALLAREDLVVHISGVQQWRRPQPRAPKNSWSGDRLMPLCHSRFSQASQGDMVIHPSWYPCSLPETWRKKERGWAIISESGDILLLVAVAICLMTYHWSLRF